MPLLMEKDKIANISAEFVEDWNVNQNTFRNRHYNEILKYSSLPHNLQNINIFLSHSRGTLTYSIPKLITDQITLGNKYETEVTRNIILNGSESKSSMEIKGGRSSVKHNSGKIKHIML